MECEQTLKPHHILCINSGSSSLKFALYYMGEGDEKLLVRGACERIGLGGGVFWLMHADTSEPTQYAEDFVDHAAAVEKTFEALAKAQVPLPLAVGHRVVHGGAFFTAPTLLDAAVLETLRTLIPFAPLHLPSEILCIEAIAKKYAALPQVACFDTAFHRRMPEKAQRFALPRSLWHEGVRRYGFHGLSYEFIMETLGSSPPSRIIIAHLGNGASMAAVRDGIPQDTSMGLTPTGGLIMGTRCGDLDPGVFLYLLRKKHLTVDELDNLVNKQSGLLGVSGVSPDMKTLLDLRLTHSEAAEAVEMFCCQVQKYIGAYAAVLGGVDLLIFTGGIGERAAVVRAQICQGLKFLGVILDEEANSQHANSISDAKSSCAVRVIPTNEDLIIARHTMRCMSKPREASSL